LFFGEGGQIYPKFEFILLFLKRSKVSGVKKKENHAGFNFIFAIKVKKKIRTSLLFINVGPGGRA